MKSYLVIPMILATLLTTYSCTNSQGTSTGNPLVAISMTGASTNATAQLNKHQFSWLINQAYALTPPSSMLDAVSSTVVVSSFWISISEIEFKSAETAGNSEVDGSDVEFTGPYTINIFDPNPQSLASSEISTNAIRRIKYKTKKVADVSAGNPAGMVNHTLYVVAAVASKNFTLRSGEEIQYETAGPNLVTFANNQNLLLEVLTAEIFRKIDLTNVTNNAVIDESNKINATGACPTIDASANDIYTCFIKAIQKQTKVGKDDNGDSELQPSEETIN